MTKSRINLLGIFITILAGTYFYVTYCSECAVDEKKAGVTVSAVSLEFRGTAENFHSGQGSLFTPGKGLQNYSLPPAYILPTPVHIPVQRSDSELFNNTVRPLGRVVYTTLEDLSLYPE